MKVLLHLPGGTLRQCFRSVDLDRLRQHHTIQLPSDKGGTALLDDFNRHAGAAHVLITGWGTPDITPAMLEQASQLKAIVHSAGSIRQLAPAEVWQRGIRVATCNGALAIGVAETTLGMMISGLKGFFPGHAWTRNGHWHDPRLGTDHNVIRELFGVTIGVISASKVGLHVVSLLRNFEVEILLYDPFMTQDRAKEMGARLVSLEELMRLSDVVSLHAPALPATRHLLRREHFKAMKDHAIFINTSRGMIVDEAALIEELKTGRIFAFIDVTDPEPPAKDHPFRALPNVVLTPHIAGNASNGCFRQGRSAVDQVLEFAEGRRMHGEVTAEMCQVMA
ncbi:MAG: hydroxyacid dehydrogenase [Verrucomicrobia bacterium]|nr:hydroxyacid dehydrogenase [Verrucomicrobiota bacterium]